ncbi:MAG TPA: hypothetical protein PKD17_06110 [Cellvibrionaceae bacterium]|nr:hypothetical protein [Cellvibrionaceae bacterium]HMW71373.1 hypothetical protein [Cellvibrionaceae bacterium]HMY37872.1 hypothetical protein [Marinagarivorans sp.]HNG58946.1 hypothetical protein [Cellvibrionaceae bacterium]
MLSGLWRLIIEGRLDLSFTVIERHYVRLEKLATGLLQISLSGFHSGAGGDRFDEKIFKGPLARMIREALSYIQLKIKALKVGFILFK